MTGNVYCSTRHTRKVKNLIQFFFELFFYSNKTNINMIKQNKRSLFVCVSLCGSLCVFLCLCVSHSLSQSLSFRHTRTKRKWYPSPTKKQHKNTPNNFKFKLNCCWIKQLISFWCCALISQATDDRDFSFPFEKANFQTPSPK